jgi:hypothetical protein
MMLCWKSLFLLVIWIGSASATEYRQASKHVHGEGTLNIAVDGKTAVVEFRAPAESIYGFEHEAKTDADKNRRDAGLNLLKGKMHEMMLFEPGLGCKFAAKNVAVAKEEGDHKETSAKSGKDEKSAEHWEVTAEYAVACNKPLAGSTLRFGFTKIFPNLGELKVQVLAESKQTGLTVRKDKGRVKF